MQRLEVSDAVRHIFVIRRLKVNRELIGAQKHLMCCEGCAVELKLPADGVNKQRKA
jgi:hypothetical protein